ERTWAAFLLVSITSCDGGVSQPTISGNVRLVEARNKLVIAADTNFDGVVDRALTLARSGARLRLSFDGRAEIRLEPPLGFFTAKENTRVIVFALKGANIDRSLPRDATRVGGITGISETAQLNGQRLALLAVRYECEGDGYDGEDPGGDDGEEGGDGSCGD